MHARRTSTSDSSHLSQDKGTGAAQSTREAKNSIPVPVHEQRKIPAKTDPLGDFVRDNLVALFDSCIPNFKVWPYHITDFRNLFRNSKAIQLGWDKASMAKLLQWAKSFEQFNKTVLNVPSEIWERDILPNYVGEELNNQLLIDKSLEALKPKVDKFNALVGLPENVIALGELLYTVNKSYVEELKSKNELVQKAYGLAGGSAKEVINAQFDFQNWLMGKLDKNQIMSVQRSVGFEFEFANYRYKGASPPPSHTELKKSADFSRLFPIPFVLETDSGQILEIGMPPMLVGLQGKGPDKTALSKLLQLFRKKMYDVGRLGLGDTVKELEIDFGANWRDVAPGLSEKLTVAPRDSDKLQEEKNDYVYSQMNISLTSEEIADFTHSVGGPAYTSYPHEYFQKAYNDIYELLCSAERSINDPVKKAIVHVSKGISNLLAIPSIEYAAQDSTKVYNSDVSSTVKETFGIWVKDSIPNVVDNALTVAGDRSVLSRLLDTNKARVKKIMHDHLENYLDTYFKVDLKLGQPALSEYLTKMDNELEATLAGIISRLSNRNPVYAEHASVKFGHERFPASGNGVRKDTFVNIPVGRNAQKHMHLAEIRNDRFIGMFLS